MARDHRAQLIIEGLLAFQKTRAHLLPRFKGAELYLDSFGEGTSSAGNVPGPPLPAFCEQVVERRERLANMLPGRKVYAGVTAFRTPFLLVQTEFRLGRHDAVAALRYIAFCETFDLAPGRLSTPPDAEEVAVWEASLPCWLWPDDQIVAHVQRQDQWFLDQRVDSDTLDYALGKS